MANPEHLASAMRTSPGQSRWKDHDAYQQALARLMRDLQAGGSAPDP